MPNYGIFDNLAFYGFLNEKETIPARKAEKLAKEEISVMT